MAGSVEKRELLIPIRTILIVSAAIGVLGAFVAIGDTFLIVFVGIFLGLVFEFPVRFVIRKTGWSRGLAATVTVLGTAIGVVLIGLLFLVPMVGSVRDFLHDLPQTIDQLRSSDELSWLGNTGIGKNLHEGAARPPSRSRTRSPRCLASQATSSASSWSGSRSSSSACSS